MSRSVLKAGDTLNNLLKKGFELANKNKSKDHKYLVYRLDDKVILYTKVSHGRKGKDLGRGLIHQMAVQCKLSNREFLDLATCPLSKEGFKKIILADPNLK